MPEYRNGGLFIDFGLLTPKRPITEPLAAADERVVEWRVWTVLLLDELLLKLQQELKVDSTVFDLPKMLEAVSWKGGREIAAEKRIGGGPPWELISDGTVF